MRQVIESRVRASGVELALVDSPANGPTVFFAHATGFHARCWDQTLERLPGLRCLVIDMRAPRTASPGLAPTVPRRTKSQGPPAKCLQREWQPAARRFYTPLTRTLGVPC